FSAGTQIAGAGHAPGNATRASLRRDPTEPRATGEGDCRLRIKVRQQTARRPRNPGTAYRARVAEVSRGARKASLETDHAIATVPTVPLKAKLLTAKVAQGAKTALNTEAYSTAEFGAPALWAWSCKSFSFALASSSCFCFSAICFLYFSSS